MKRFKKNLILILGISLLFILSNCTKYKEEAPFFEGLYLKYRKISGCWEETYQMTALKDGNFKLIKKEGCPNYKILPPPEKYIINIYGKILEGPDDRLEGKRIDIWVPPSRIDDSNAKVEKTYWQNWDVLIIKSTIAPVEIFYDVSTGFKVGTHTGAMPGVAPMTMILVDTNADIPVKEE